MGVLQRLGILPTTLTPPTPEELSGPIYGALAMQMKDLPVEELWEQQPHLRTVTDFIARSVSSTGLHVYRRMEDGGRERVRSGWLADLCKKSSKSSLMSSLIYRAVMDYCLYDEWIWYVTQREDQAPEILPIPHHWVHSTRWEDPWTMKSLVLADERGRPFEIPADRIIRQHGYSPHSLANGTSAITALRETLQEQLESAAYRAQLWRNGPRLGGIITRPKDVKWDDTARNRFKRSWSSQYSGRGSGAGGVPVLEDGMDFKAFHLKADDEKVVEVTKLSLQTVASAFHINPTMVGLLDNANYSNVREFRKSLYGDSLGPVIKQLEDVLNEFLIPMLAETMPAEDTDGVYFEFNLDEKLRASFEEKAAVTSTAVGGPWMAPNEARAMNNMPAIEGGDDLLRPLNVSAAGAPEIEPTVDDPPKEEAT